MKTTRGFIAVIMSLCMCLCLPVGVFAASNTESVETVTTTSEYGFELPADAVIVYEDERICMYQSLSKSAEESEIVPYIESIYKEYFFIVYKYLLCLTHDSELT